MSSAAAAAKTVLVVDDQQTIRDTLVKSLEWRGFNAKGASNINQAREIVEELGSNIDVAVLDMRLQDKEHLNLTGADLGQEVRNALRLPPEFLIFSGFTEPAYLTAASRLGTAAYLVKGPVKPDELIRHIRALALRRALNTERKEVGEKIERIAEKAYSRSAAIQHLCRQVIEPELKACLGLPALMLLSDEKGTHTFGDDPRAAGGHNAAYQMIQDWTFTQINSDGPFILHSEHAQAAPDAQTGETIQRLEGGSFLRLYSAHNLRFSIGILPSEGGGDHDLPEDPGKLASILNTYLRTPVSELLNLLERVEAAIEKAKRRTLLQHTSRFCLYVGQTQRDVLNEAVEQKELDSESQYFKKLKRLASDLIATGNEFSQLSDEGAQKSAVAEAVSVAAVVKQAVAEVEEQFFSDRLKLVVKGEDFDLRIDRRDLLVAVLRVLQWMAQREEKTPEEAGEPVVEVEYLTANGRAEIHFLDRSRRLSVQLREHLFEPFSQAPPARAQAVKEEEAQPTTEQTADELPGLYMPLYLAKMLIEQRYHGRLEDRTGKSDKLEGRHGHHFVIRFAAEEEEVWPEEILET
jgi:DNA-binding response OmpR family regulator/signal transduction histidine kinase